MAGLLSIYLLSAIYTSHPDLSRGLSNGLSGILVGLIYTLLYLPVFQKTQRLPWRFIWRYRRLFDPSIYSYIVLGGILFFFAGTFGAGIVYGIDFVGKIAEEGSFTETVVVQFVQGNLYAITFIGGLFGFYVGGLGRIVDAGILRNDSIGFGVRPNWCIPFHILEFCIFGTFIHTIYNRQCAGKDYHQLGCVQISVGHELENDNSRFGCLQPYNIALYGLFVRACTIASSNSRRALT